MCGQQNLTFGVWVPIAFSCDMYDSNSRSPVVLISGRWPCCTSHWCSGGCRSCWLECCLISQDKWTCSFLLLGLSICHSWETVTKSNWGCDDPLPQTSDVCDDPLPQTSGWLCLVGGVLLCKCFRVLEGGCSWSYMHAVNNSNEIWCVECSNYNTLWVGLCRALRSLLMLN